MRKIILALLAAVVLGSGLLSGGAVYAAGICPSDAPNQSAKTPAECFLDPPSDAETDLMGGIKNILDAVIGVVGVVAVVVMIIGGISFITAQGDAPKVMKARNTILYGLIGLVIAVLAFAIVNFVLGALNKTTTPADDGGVYIYSRMISGK